MMHIWIIVYAAGVAALTVAEYRNSRARFWIKPLLAVGFVVAAVIAVQAAPSAAPSDLVQAYAPWLIGGLMACALGDVLLLKDGTGNSFIVGMAAFALGHVLFVIAFSTLARLAIEPLPALALVVLGLGYAVWVTRGHPILIRIAASVYALIIAAMVVSALCTATWLIWPALAFAISDLFVAQNRFKTPRDWHALAITPLYFGAQFAFALSPALLWQ